MFLRTHDMYMRLCEVRCLLYRLLLRVCLGTARTGAFEHRRKVWVDIVQIMFRMAYKHAETRTRTKPPFVVATRDTYVAMRLQWHHRDGCHNVRSLEDGVTRIVFSSSRQHRKEES